MNDHAPVFPLEMYVAQEVREDLELYENILTGTYSKPVMSYTCIKRHFLRPVCTKRQWLTRSVRVNACIIFNQLGLQPTFGARNLSNLIRAISLTISQCKLALIVKTIISSIPFIYSRKVRLKHEFLLGAAPHIMYKMSF